MFDLTGRINRQVDFLMDKQMQQGDTMRSSQMAIQIAMNRDIFQWGSVFYGVLCTGVAAATLERKAFPRLALPPLLIGGGVLAFIYDGAYGTKMARVRLEAEHILKEERERLIPLATMPHTKFWQKEIEQFKKQHNAPKRVGETLSFWKAS